MHANPTDPGFAPQFHTMLRQADDATIWIASPPPYTEIAFKARFHAWCRQEEEERLTAAGDVVLALPLSM